MHFIPQTSYIFRRCVTSTDLCRGNNTLTFILYPFRLPSILLLNLPYNLVHSVCILSSRDSPVWQLSYIRKRIQSTSEIRFPSSWICLVDARSVSSTMTGPAFENAGVSATTPTLPRCVFPRDFKYPFFAILPL